MWKKIKIVLGILAISFLWNCDKEKLGKNSNRGHENDAKSDSIISVSKNGVKYKRFAGAWFTIEYPENFTAKNSEKSSTFEGKFDSAIFTSPDGKVQFYVFSPQWSGNPKDIIIDKNSETKIDSTLEKNGNLVVKRWLIEANNGSYNRAYEETIDHLSNTNKIFGISYDQSHYKNEYEKEYLHFKKSLVQYAD